MVEFAGYEMPLRYQSQIAEHNAVRTQNGCFDVSHMGVIDMEGNAARQFLKYVLASDIGRLQKIGNSFYTIMLNENAGIIDDLIVYRLQDGYRAIVNAGTKESDLEHLIQIRDRLGLDVKITLRTELNVIAVQGPKAVETTCQILKSSEIKTLKRFNADTFEEIYVARTGYTGEDGVEVLADDEHARWFWRRLLEEGVQPCGLAARDSLRLEAGLNLNTQDMTASTTPDEANLKWTVHAESDRTFHGQAQLESKRARGLTMQLTGLVVEDKGIVRAGCDVKTNAGNGVVTSGLFSPTLGYSIALARVPVASKGTCSVQVRNRELSARLVRPPFVRNGEKVHR